MFITLVHDEREIIPKDPNDIAVSCENMGWDTSEWYGKANSVVFRRGLNPSYGTFLISADDAAYIRENVLYMDIVVQLDEKEDDEYIEKLGKNFQVYTLKSITPSYEGRGSIYLLELVDHRAGIPGVDMEMLKDSPDNSTNINRKYINYVIHHDGSNFIYDSDSVKTYLQTFSEEIRYPTETSTSPLGWKDTIEAILMLRCGGSYSGGIPRLPAGSQNTFSLDDTGIVYPETPPQNVYMGLHSDIAATLYKLLFALNCDLLYDGEGGFTLVEIKDTHDIETGNEKNVFEEKMEFDVTLEKYLDGEMDGNKLKKAASLVDKRFDLTETGFSSLLPENLVACAKWVPTQNPGIKQAEYKQEVIKLFEQLGNKPITGPGSIYVEVPVAWSKTYNSSSSPMNWYKTLWGNTKDTLLWCFPPKVIKLSGWVNLKPNRYIHQVCWHMTSTHDGGTWVSNVLPINWDKLAPVQEFTDSPDIITGKTSSAISADTTTFPVKEIKVICGVDPRNNITSNNETVEIEKPQQIEISSDSIVYAIRNRTTYKWQLLSGTGGTTTPGGGGTVTPVGVVQFRLIEDLRRYDFTARAVLIDLYGRAVDENGKPIPDPDLVPDWAASEDVVEGDIRKATVADPVQAPQRWQIGDFIASTFVGTRTTGLSFNSQEAQFWDKTTIPLAKTVLVVNPDFKFYGYKQYSSKLYDGVESGFIGTAFKLQSQGVSNNSSAGDTGGINTALYQVWEPNHVYQENEIVRLGDFEEKYIDANGEEATRTTIYGPGSYRTGDLVYARNSFTSNNKFDYKESKKWLRVKDYTEIRTTPNGPRWSPDPVEDAEQTASGPKYDRYQIIEMEAEARWIEGKVIAKSSDYNNATYENLETQGEVVSCYMTVENFWGAAPNNRAPKLVDIYLDRYQSTELTTIEDSNSKPTPDPGVIRSTIGTGVKVIFRLNELGVGEQVPIRALYDDLEECYLFDKAGLIRPVLLIGARLFNQDGSPSTEQSSRDGMPVARWLPNEDHLVIPRQSTKFDYNAYELVGDLREGKTAGYTIGNKIWVDSLFTAPLTVPNGKALIGYAINNTLVGVDPIEIVFPLNDQETT